MQRGPKSHNISSPKLLNLTGPKQERVACKGAPNHINVKPKLLNFTETPNKKWATRFATFEKLFLRAL